MTYLTQRFLQKRILRSQFLRLALISLVLVAFQATPASAQCVPANVCWQANGNNISNTNTNGNVGIGTPTPPWLLTIEKDFNGPAVMGVFNTADGPDAQVGFGVSRTLNYANKYFVLGITAPSFATPGFGETGYLHSSGVPIKLGTQTANDIYFFTNGISNTRLTVASGGNVGIGTTTPNSLYKLDINGNTNVAGNIDVTGTGNITAAGTIEGGNIKAKYQDVAEWVESSQVLPVGTVVVLDHTKPNQVVASSQSYDTGVAGIISKQPGITLGQSSDSKVLVATTGRVRVKVDANRGGIHIGDLLVTSDVPGVAMKSEPIKIGGRLMHMPGTLIGKALEPLAKGQGEILVLLSLQ